MRAVLECLVEGLSAAKDPVSTGAFVALLEFGSPGAFDSLVGGVSAAKLAALRATALWPDYDACCRGRIAPALRAWLDKANDEYEALRALSAMLQYSPSRELAEDYFERLLALVRKGETGFTGGVGAAIRLLAKEERENMWLRLLDAGLPDPAWTRYAITGLSTCATTKSIPEVKRALREEYETGSDTVFLRNCRHAIRLTAMRLLAKLCNGPEHAPPAQFAGNEAQEMLEPGGRLAELLEYWRDRP